MKHNYSASDFEPNEVVVGDVFISTYTSKEEFLKLNKDVELLANDSLNHLDVLQSDIYRNRIIVEEKIEKLQNELQEFKKTTNEFQRHLIVTSITLSVAVVFILILISFYYK
jgi:t-SNARE complex subunit (syntaxin)